MSYTYRGTKITGTSTAGKKFPKSGLKSAKKGQTYFNKSTGHVYKCTEGGKPKDAKWKYLRTDIAKKPSVAVSSLGAPVRESGTHKMKATWKTPAAMVDKKKGNRATALDIHWYLGIAGKDPDKVVKTTNEKATESTINLNNLTIGNKEYKRKDFYPFANKPVLNYVTVKVTSRNAKGAGASAKATRDFLIPRKPTISDFTFNAETGEVSCTIDTDAGDDYYERYDTWYKMTVYYSDTKETKTIHDTSTTYTSKTITFDDADYASRPYEEYAKVTVQAWARGYKGSSKPAEKVFYVAYPAQASIDDVQVSSKDSTGKCTIYVNTHSTDEHPVDRVKLEYLANSDYAEANMIPGDASWEQTDILDDATCKALAMSVSNLIPDRGKYTWIRLKTFHANETVLYRYSQYWRVKDLETPAATAADDKITIVSATAGADGKSAVVHLAWDDGELPSTGTEISWDEEEDAWKSTKTPSDYEFTWEDKTAQGQPIPVTVGGVTYPHSATITIKGLDESSKYFVKARRYNEGDETTYSEYSNSATVITSEKPESVTATADRYIPRGSGLNVYWTFAGNGLQREWQIVQDDIWYELSIDTEVISEKTYYEYQGGEYVVVTPIGTEDPSEEGWYEKFGNTVIAHGEGSLGSIQIPADRLESFAINGDLTFTVQVSTGSGFVISEQKKVTIIEPPELELIGDSLINGVLKTNDLSLTFQSNKVCDIKLIVTSQGCASQFPQGMLRQTAGDTIHSNVYIPVWDEVNGEFTTTINLPPALDFWDLGSYTVFAVGIDRQTNLSSEPVVKEFSVLWAHQAPSIEPTEVYTLSEDTEVSDDKNYYTYDSETQIYTVVEPEGTEDPSEEGWYEVTITEYVTLTPIDETDDTGFHHMAVQIDLTPPPNALADDVYDIYRVTGDGAQLIGQGFPQTFTTTDEYAPFGEDLTNYYRIATRTADGDVAFSDFEYVLEGDGIRLDWSGGFLEYPYGVSIGDSYQKDVDIRHHLNGGISSYWNQGIERKGSLGTEAIKVIQKSDIDLTRQLARYTGPVFVRTREGTAFEADVQITDLSSKNIAIMTIAIDATEVDLTEEFMLPTPFNLEEEEESSGE